MIHYKKKKNQPFFWPTILILCLLIFLSYHYPGTSRFPSKLLNTVIGPIHSALYFSSEKAHDLYRHFFGDPATQAEVARLREENAKYKEEIIRLEEVLGQSESLKNYAELLRKAPKEAIQAHVSAMDSKSQFKSFTVNKGEKDGVRMGDIIVQGTKDPKSMVVEALVGQVTEVGLNYAKVRSLKSESSNVSVMFSGTGGYGIINSRDEENFEGYLLDPSLPVKKGEAALSSGIGGVYPRGLYIGRVSDVESSEDGLTKTFTISSSVNFNQLYWVLILHPEQIDQNFQSQDLAPEEEKEGPEEDSGQGQGPKEEEGEENHE